MADQANPFAVQGDVRQPWRRYLDSLVPLRPSLHRYCCRLTGNVWHYDPKYVVTLLVLVAYVFYLRLARNPGWRGARASQLCIFNFAIVIFSFTVVNLFFSRSHRYF